MGNQCCCSDEVPLGYDSNVFHIKNQIQHRKKQQQNSLTVKQMNSIVKIQALVRGMQARKKLDLYQTFSNDYEKMYIQG